MSDQTELPKLGTEATGAFCPLLCKNPPSHNGHLLLVQS